MFRSLARTIVTAAALMMIFFVNNLVAQTAPSSSEGARRAVNTPSSPFRRASERAKAESLLKQARAAATDGNFELAIWYVDAADKLQVNYDSMFHRFSDTPAKARIEIQRMRAMAPAPKPNTIAAQPNAQPLASDPASTVPRDRPPQPLAQTPPEKPAVAQAAAISETPANLDVAAHAVPSDSSPALYENQYVGQETPRQLQAVSLVDPANAAARQAQRAIPTAPPQANRRLDGNDVATSELIARGTQMQDARGIGNPNHPPQWSVLRERSLGWLAESKAALDRGDTELAERFARAAQELRVPDSEYRAGDPRPWMLLMEVAQRQRRVDASPQPLSVGFDPLPSDLPRTGIVGEPPIGPPYQGVTPAVAHPHQGVTPIAPVAAQQLIPANSATPGPPFPGIENPFVPQGTAPPGTVTAPPGDVAGAQYQGEGQTAYPYPSGTGPLPAAPMVQRGTPNSPAQEPGSGATPTGPTPTMPVLAVDLRSTGTDPTVPQTAPPPQSVTEGMRFFREGRTALESHNMELAQELFRQAWQHRQDLDEATVQQLQDHLQVLRSTSVTGPAEIPVRSVTESTAEPESGAAKALVSQVAREQAAIRAMKEADPTGAWERLKRLKETISKATVEESVRSQLYARVDSDSRELETYVTHNRVRLETEARNKEILAEIERARQQRTRNEEMLAELTVQFNELMEQQRFSEAIVVAKKARELAPEEPVVQNMIEKSRVARQVVTSMMRNERYQGAALAALNDVDSAGIPIEGNIEFPEARYWEDITSSRRKQLAAQQRRYSQEELAIREALTRKIDVQFEQVPLSSVLDQIAQEAGINVFLDPEGLTAEGLTSNVPVNLSLPRPISLRSALNLMLEPLHLSYVIDNEVLRITTEQVKQSKPEQRYYKVADLVIRIPNFVPNNDVGLPGALREGFNVASRSLQTANATNQPLTIIAEDPTLKPTLSNASVLAQMQASGVYPGQPSSNAVATSESDLGGGALVDFDTLIQLITTTVEPDSWEDNGGAGTIAGFPTNLSLVVSNTQEVHEKIVDLLEQLRQLQDLQITIEVRFITLNDSFFERIGVDFDFNIDDNTGMSVVDLQNLDDVGPSVTVGLDPSGVITPDLDVKFNQGSFGATLPTFGGFAPGVGANVGFAILSDIEAFFLIEAAQGDTRTNVLQAPKVTLYDGQTASVSDVSQRPFVTSVIPVVADFAVGHQPVITVLTEGTTLQVQAVVSNDRRFVRLTLVPFFSSIGDVDTFTFIGRTDSDSGTTPGTEPTDDPEPTPPRDNVRRMTEGTTVQLPTLAFTSVSTTVSVPDGGTILLGGIKRLSEGRNERGVPMLSKVPYVNRLFKNVGIGRDTQSLMMMVTPRIIIQEEEEQKLGI